MIMGLNGKKPVGTAKKNYTSCFQNAVNFIKKLDVIRNMLIYLGAYYYIKRALPKGKIHCIA
jgi:hypothetical protein